MIPFIAYLSTIVLANLTLLWVGLIPVGFGLMAPAGVLWAGLALTLRDWNQDANGRSITVGAIALGAGISALFDPVLGVASGVAFLVSELADFAVYTPIRKHHWLLAIFASNTVGLVIDSALFLWLAFGSLDFLAGQVWAKLVVTLVTVAALAVWRTARRREVVWA
jgi:hypothetical protein